jgi:hypothetical protein
MHLSGDIACQYQDKSIAYQIKTNLDNHASVKSQKSQITRILKNISKDEYKKTFEKWLERMQLCISNNREILDFQTAVLAEPRRIVDY